MNTDVLQQQTESAILSLIRRLKQHSKTIENDAVACDVEVAANLLAEFLRRSDDFK